MPTLLHIRVGRETCERGNRCMRHCGDALGARVCERRATAGPRRESLGREATRDLRPHGAFGIFGLHAGVGRLALRAGEVDNVQLARRHRAVGMLSLIHI